MDTQLLLWAAADDPRLTAAARSRILAGERWFSAASIWAVAIKAGLGRADFVADPGLLRQGLLANGYAELAISGGHTALVAGLPPIHRDPFDRLLLAQALAEGMLLLTADTLLASYPGPVQLI